MEINKIDGLGETKHPQRINKNPKVSKSTIISKKDEVVISGESSKLQPYQGVSKTDNSSTERAKRIEILKEQIRDGSYRVPADQITEKIWEIVRRSG